MLDAELTLWDEIDKRCTRMTGWRVLDDLVVHDSKRLGKCPAIGMRASPQPEWILDSGRDPLPVASQQIAFSIDPVDVIPKAPVGGLHGSSAGNRRCPCASAGAVDSHVASPSSI